jgi:hypothetical protein
MSCIIMQSMVNIDDSLVSDVDISAIDWHEEQNADPDIRRVKTLFQIGHKPAKRKTSLESEGVRKYLRDWGVVFLTKDQHRH